MAAPPIGRGKPMLKQATTDALLERLNQDERRLKSLSDKILVMEKPLNNEIEALVNYIK